jgi:hypothetical protein
MPKPHVVDDRELMRFWLEQRHERQGFGVPKLAKALNISATAVGHWLRGRNSVHPKYWPVIAQFFGYAQPEQMLDEARALKAA